MNSRVYNEEGNTKISYGCQTTIEYFFFNLNYKTKKSWITCSISLSSLNVTEESHRYRVLVWHDWDEDLHHGKTSGLCPGWFKYFVVSSFICVCVCQSPMNQTQWQWELCGFHFLQEYLHTQQCIHGNVGAHSVLVGGDQMAKLWGLGPAYRQRAQANAAEAVDDMELKKWQAPEVLSRRTISPSSDVWVYGPDARVAWFSICWG